MTLKAQSSWSKGALPLHYNLHEIVRDLRIRFYPFWSPEPHPRFLPFATRVLSKFNFGQEGLNFGQSLPKLGAVPLHVIVGSASFEP